MTLWLLAIGAISMLGQVILLRELNVAFFGSELVYVLALGVWLLGTAAGAVSGRRAHVPAEGAVRWMLIALGAVLPLSVVLARGVRILCGGVPGAYLPFGRQMLAMLACLTPVAFLLGVLFQWTAKRFVAPRRTLATAYAVESLGGLFGGLLATLLLAVGIQNFGAALLCALAAFAAAAWPPGRGARRAATVAVAGTVLALAALATSPALDSSMTAWNHPRLLATGDTPYGRVTVTGMLGQTVVFENDALAYESEGTAAEEFVHLAALQRDSVRSVLILGGAVQGLVPEMLRHHPRRVDDVELDAAMLARVLPLEPPTLRRALADPRVRIMFADPRRFLARAGIYDLILVGMPEPESGRTNRYYTREFFAECARHLGGEGVLALRLRSAENLWTPVLARRAASIHRALRAVFPQTVVLPGVTNLFLASRAPLTHDPAPLAERLRRRDLGARLVTPAYLRYLYTNDRFAEIVRLLAVTRARANRDARPVCYQTTMLLWLSRFFPRLGRLDLPEPGASALLRSPWSWGCGLAVLGLFVLGRRRGVFRRALLVAAAGFAGMVLEAMLLLQYQTRAGVLYQDLGVLLTMFMGGLALGATALEFTLRRLQPGGDASRLPGFVTLAAFCLLGLGSAALLMAGAVGGLASTSLLLLACGVLVAATFSYAALDGAPEQRALVGPLYAADLFGGCLGSLAAGFAAIPMLGLPATAALAALTAAAALLLI